MMKLHWSPTAPFVRKVLICAHELGLADRIELVRTRVGPTRINPDIQKDNPLNKVPTLLTDAGEPLYDSRVIAEYLDSLKDGGGTLFPKNPAQRWKAIRRQVLADGIIDVVILKRDEDFRGPRHQSPAHQAAFAAKTIAGLDQGESEAGDMAASPWGIGQIAWGCALSYFDLRAPELNWREGRPDLAAWHEEQFVNRPSSLAVPMVAEGEGKFAFYRFSDEVEGG